EPERRAIARAYCDLADQIGPEAEPVLAATLSTPTREIQDFLGALGRDHSPEGERLRVLVDQTDRLRLSSFQLGRLRSQINGAREQLGTDVDKVFEVAVRLLRCVSDCLIGEERRKDLAGLIREVNAAVTALRSQLNLDDG